jgi:hypothetical protein
VLPLKQKPALKSSVAEVLRRFGADYLAQHSLSTAQAKAWRAIVACRTAALGGKTLVPKKTKDTKKKNQGHPKKTKKNQGHPSLTRQSQQKTKDTHKKPRKASRTAKAHAFS